MIVMWIISNATIDSSYCLWQYNITLQSPQPIGVYFAVFQIDWRHFWWLEWWVWRVRHSYDQQLIAFHEETPQWLVIPSRVQIPNFEAFRHLKPRGVIANAIHLNEHHVNVSTRVGNKVLFARRFAVVEHYCFVQQFVYQFLVVILLYSANKHFH